MISHSPVSSARRSPSWSSIGRTRKATRSVALNSSGTSDLVLPSARLHPGLSGLTFRTSGPGGQACVAAVYLRGHMDQESLRLLILRKLRAGRLPRDGTRTVWSGPSDGETCDACDTVLAKTELLMEGATLDLGRRPLQLHVRCFQIWDRERRAT